MIFLKAYGGTVVAGSFQSILEDVQTSFYKT
jgi:hypothetical protein